MKLAMAVGDNRRYAVDTVLPRHFLQTTKVCGLSAKNVKTTIDGAARRRSVQDR